MFANKAKALMFVASLALAAASAYLLLQEDASPPAKLKPLAVVSPSFIKEAKDPRANQYLPVVKSLSASYAAYFLGGWTPSDVVDSSLMAAAKEGFYGRSCNIGSSNPYSRGTISSTAACCVNTLNSSINESMPAWRFSEEPEIYKISRLAYDTLSASNYLIIRSTVENDLTNSIASIPGATLNGVSVRVSNSAVSANLVNNTVENINELTTTTRAYGSCGAVECRCTNWAIDPSCVLVTFSGWCGSMYLSIPCLVGEDPIRPGKPSALFAYQVSRTETELTWTVPMDPDIQFYYIYIDNVKRDQIPKVNLTVIGSTAIYLLDEAKMGYVIPEGTPCFNVAAADSIGEGPKADVPACIPIDKTPPAAPTLSGTKCEPAKACFSWTAPADAMSYRLYRAVGPVSRLSTLVSPTAATSYNDTDPTMDNVYNYTVTALDQYGNEGTESNRVAIVFDVTPPGAPAAFSATLVNETTGLVNLSWSAPAAPDLQGYAVYRNGTLLVALAKAATSYSDDLSQNGTYTYRISAFDEVPNYGPNATSAAITADNITLAPAVREIPADLRLEHDVSVAVTATLNKTIHRVTLYKRVSSLFFDVDVDVNYTIGGVPYAESFSKRLTITPSEIPVGSGQPVGTRILEATRAVCGPSKYEYDVRYTYETSEQANIAVMKSRGNPADVVNDWLNVAVRYTESDIHYSECTSGTPVVPGVNTGIAYGPCVVS